MPQITIPEATFKQLTDKATAANMTVEEYLEPVLSDIVEPRPPTTESAPQDHETWKEWLEEWHSHVQARSGKYPPGFRVDVSRESFMKDNNHAYGR